jgi:2-iminobutanoate/2-iminopropanoate deaminase
LEDNMIVPGKRLISIIAGAGIAAALTTPLAAKECYAPDARAQERAFSRAVTTEGGKIAWLGGQTGSPDKNFEGQVRDIFASLDKTIKAVGGSGLKDMVTMTVFINDVPTATA